jgi:hypothetical protein
MVSRTSPISRRQALKVGLAAGALIPLGPGAVAGESLGQAAATESRAPSASRRVEDRLPDASVTTTTATGTVYAQHTPDGRLLPLFGIATVTRVRWWSGDGLGDSLDDRRSLRRISVFTDLGYGRPIEVFKNPFNGHFCRIVVPIEEIHETVAEPSLRDAARDTRRIRLPWYPWLLMQGSPGGLVVDESSASARRWRDASLDPSVWNQIESIAPDRLDAPRSWRGRS